MLKYILAVLLFVGIAFAQVEDANVRAIEVDVTSGQIYVVDDKYFYEIDNVALEQNMAHYIKDVYINENSLFVTKIAGKRRLYAVQSFGTSESDDGAAVEYMKVPIGNQKTVPVVARTVIAQAPAHHVVYDKSKNIAIMGNSRNLTLVDLVSMEVLDALQGAFTTRTGGFNFIIDKNTNRIIKFYTRYPIGSSLWGLSAVEYTFASGKIEYAEDTFEITGTPSESPFYQVELVEENCRIDNANNRIWCAVFTKSDERARTLFSFQANNLSNSKVVSLTVDYDNVVYDFVNKFAYAIEATEPKGFKVHKVNLNTGALIKSYTNTDVVINSYVTKLDPAEPHLYIAVTGSADAKIFAVKTESMTGKLIPLTTSGYYL